MLQGLLEAGNKLSEHDEAHVQHLLQHLASEHALPLHGVFARLSLGAGNAGPPAASHGAHSGDIGARRQRPAPPGRLLPRKVTGMLVSIGWKVSPLVGGWWAWASRCLLGLVSFELQVLRPVGELSKGQHREDSDDGDLELEARTVRAGKVDEISKWQVVHRTKIDFSSAKTNLGGVHSFACNLTEKVGRWGLPCCLLRPCLLSTTHLHRKPISSSAIPHAHPDRNTVNGQRTCSYESAQSLTIRLQERRGRLKRGRSMEQEL